MNYKKILPKRQQTSHKGTFGKILNWAGSENYRGAAFLSSVSALKIGAGYVTLACPSEIVSSISSKSPDLTFLPLNGLILENLKKIEQNLPKFDTFSLGCGIGTENRTLNLFDKVLSLLKKSDKPTIIDADGLNAISLLSVKKLPKNVVITPHEAEMARLMNAEVSQISENRVFFAKEASKKYACTVVLKGHGTVICSENQEFVINKTGNSALAKAGSGDVLTGIITGLVAQGCKPFDAAVLGVHLHGICGELASSELTQYSVLASDLINYIPLALNKI